MQPTFFINHGGGPCFFLEPGPMRNAWIELEDYLQEFASKLDETPNAILIVSGHWIEQTPTVNGGAAPSLLFDYGGFPTYTYELTWPAPGAPVLGQLVSELLGTAGISCKFNNDRGWDHGVFVPLKVMFPNAEIPVVQLSLVHGLDPAAHLEIGRSLRKLRDDGVLIIGSGQSYHNMRGFMGGRPDNDPQAEAFDAWLKSSMTDVQNREDALIHWEAAPGARDAQPHEDHLLPLMIAAGAASGDDCEIDFEGHVLGKPISGFRFG